MGTERLTGPDSGLRRTSVPSRLPPIAQMQFPKLALSTPPRFPRLHFCNFQSCDCPVEVEGTPEPDCSLRCGSRIPPSLPKTPFIRSLLDTANWLWAEGLLKGRLGATENISFRRAYARPLGGYGAGRTGFGA